MQLIKYCCIIFHYQRITVLAGITGAHGIIEDFLDCCCMSQPFLGEAMNLHMYS